MNLPTNNNFQDPVNELTLREQLETYLSKWIWFVISVVVMLVLSYIYLRYTTPMYQTTAQIIVKDDRGQGMTSELSVFENMGLVSGLGSNLIENEIEILQSRRLISKVVNEHNFHISYFKEGNVITTELYHQKPFTVSIVNTKDSVPISDNTLHVEVLSETSFELLNINDNTKITANFGEKIELPNYDITLLPEATLNTGEKVIVHIKNPDKVVDYYRRNLQISLTNKSSSVIRLTLQEPVPSKSQDFLDNLIFQYNKDAIDDKNLIAKNTSLFIEDRLIIISKELDSVESDKVQFKQDNRLTDIDTEAHLFLESVSDLDKQQLQITTQKRIVEDIISYLNSDTEHHLIPANLGISEEGLGSSIQSYNQLVLERERLLRSSTEQNPVVVNLTHQITQLRSGILNSLGNVKTSLETSLQSLNRQEGIFGSKISKVPDTEKEYRSIVRQQNIKEALYLFLLQKREETSLSLAVTAPKAKIVDSAYSPDEPVSPKRKIIYLGALILGLLIPFLIIYLQQLLNNKINHRKDVELIAKSLPIIGEIPKLGKKENELIQKNDTSVLAESFRILRTNLLYIFSNKSEPKSKIVFVTSTVKGEGKTFVSVNMAATFASLNHKTILIGADIRNPRLQTFFKLPKNSPGLTNYLVDDEMALDQLVVKAPNISNLDCLLSGSIPPNPAELLLNERMDVLFKELRNRYDYIIVDTAPSLLVTDTLLIQKYADYITYVVRAGYSEKRLLEFPIECLEDGRLKNVNFILNDVKMANFGYGNKYGYAYGASSKGFFSGLKKLFFGK